MNINDIKENLKEGFISNDEFCNRIERDVKARKYEIAKLRKYDPSTKGIRIFSYYNIPASFDIETTQSKETKQAFMYIWMLNVYGYSTYGRTWDEFSKVMKQLHTIMSLNGQTRLPIYIHNLGFESSFMLARTNPKDVFAVAKHNPLRWRTPLGFEFRDSAKLAGMSLEKVGEDLTEIKLKKMVGDLDYSKMRNSKTPLTEKELGYCLNDVRVLTAYIAEQIKQYGEITKIPMTNTGRVREYVREHCLYRTTKTGKKVRNKSFVGKMHDMTMTPDEYSLIRQAYWGGFTHAGHMNCDKVFKNVHSYDFTSSYPAVMCSEMFPMSAGEYMEYKRWNDYYKDMNSGYLFIGMYELWNLDDSKAPWEHPLSASNCIQAEDIREDNGRVISAGHVVIICTSVDFEIIKNHYHCSAARLHQGYRYKADYLPREFIECILTMYGKKTSLKEVKGKEAEYNLNKAMTNCIYGMSGTDIVKGTVNYSIDDEDGWDYTKADLPERIRHYNNSKTKTVAFTWALFITAYARRNLFSGIDELKEDYIYADTDSVKYRNYEKHQKYFDEYNKNIDAKMERMCKNYKIDIEKTRPKTIKGKAKPLGHWNYEGYYQKFKTLGAKRYMVKQRGKYLITVAGVDKKLSTKYIAKTQKEAEPFRYFEFGLKVPKGYSGKIAAKYSNHEASEVITDDYGNSELMKEKGFCYLEETEYCMSELQTYLQYLRSGMALGQDMKRRNLGTESINDYLESKAG